MHAGGYRSFFKTKRCKGRACTWCGGGDRWWRCGGVARGRRLWAVLWRFERRRESLLPFFFVSVFGLSLFSSLSFSFPLFLVYSSFLSSLLFVLSPLRSPPLSLCFFKKSPPLSPSVFPFIEKKTWSRYAFLSAPSITPGWSVLSVVVGASLVAVGARRERGGTFENVLPSVAANSGERKKTNIVVQNDTVLVFPFFFLYMKRRRFG